MAQLKMGLKGLKPVDLCEVANHIVNKMSGNDNFPDPVPSLEAITAKNEELEQLIIAASFGDRYQIAAKHVAYDELKALLVSLAHYVYHASEGNETAILSSGFQVRKETSKPIRVGTPKLQFCRRGTKTGEVILKWKAIHGSRSYIVEHTTSDPSKNPEWSTIAICTSSRATIQNLIPGTNHWFRVQAIGPVNQSAFSGVSLIMAA